MNFSFEVIDKNGVQKHIYHKNNLSAAKHYVDTHGNCKVRDRKTGKIIYPVKRLKEC